MAPRVASARTINDGVSSSVAFSARPGIAEVIGQQNLHPRLGLMVGLRQMSALDARYTGWELAFNTLLARILAPTWRAGSVLTLGLAGMKGPIHDHSALWARMDADWETRRVLIAAMGEVQRGNRMPATDEAQLRVGYGLREPEMNELQPWLIAGASTRTGIESSRLTPLAMVRVVTGTWWVEAGAALTWNHWFAGASLAL